MIWILIVLGSVALVAFVRAPRHRTLAEEERELREYLRQKDRDERRK